LDDYAHNFAIIISSKCLAKSGN